MKIGIDCRLSGVVHAGIGRYIENLIRRLPKLAPEIEWVYFFHEPTQIIEDLAVENRLAPVRHYSLAEQWRLPPIFKQAQLDLLHIPHFNAPLFYGQPTVITIHDLLWHQQRGAHVTTLQPWQYWPKYLAYRLVTAHSVNHAQKILVPTQTIKKTLLDYYPHAKDKIVVTYEGVDQRILQFKNEVVERKEKTLLYVGSLYPHKNVELVLRALNQLPGWNLKIVSARDAFYKRTLALVKELGVEQQVEFKGRLSDHDLAYEFQTCTALVQPSLSEGFGLTGVEALALETPLLASKIEIFQEVYQNAAIYFDPHSVVDFVKKVKTLAKNKVSAETMRQVVARYSWNEMVRETIKVYMSS